MNSGTSILKKVLRGLVGLLFIAVISQANAAEKKIVLKKYPDLKIGFTTANFAKAYPTTAANLRKLLDFASEHGFSFIEIRDANATLTSAECKALADYARQKHVEVIYSMNVGVLDGNYWEAYSRGIANAGLFEGPKVIRTAANGGEMLADEKKKYWTADEFAKIVENANRAANTARMFGLQLLVENAREGLHGDGTTTFGSTELFGSKGVNSNVGLQLDVGNFFCTSRVPSTPAAAEAFLIANVAKVGYTHLKTSKLNKAQPVLDGNQLPFETIFELLQKNGKNYVAIELDPAPAADQAFENHLKSAKYLVSNF
jgi:sugar phosphate isomerase/epimerase